MDVQKAIARILAHAPLAAELRKLAPEVSENITAGLTRILEEEAPATESEAPAPAAKPAAVIAPPSQTPAAPATEAPASPAVAPAVETVTFPRAVTEHDVKFMVAHGYSPTGVAWVGNYLSHLNADDLRGFFAGSDAWVEGTPAE